MSAPWPRRAAASGEGSPRAAAPRFVLRVGSPTLPGVLPMPSWSPTDTLLGDAPGGGGSKAAFSVFTFAPAPAAAPAEEFERLFAEPEATAPPPPPSLFAAEEPSPALSAMPSEGLSPSSAPHEAVSDLELDDVAFDDFEFGAGTAFRAGRLPPMAPDSVAPDSVAHISAPPQQSSQPQQQQPQQLHRSHLLTPPPPSLLPPQPQPQPQPPASAASRPVRAASDNRWSVLSSSSAGVLRLRRMRSGAAGGGARSKKRRRPGPAAAPGAAPPGGKSAMPAACNVCGDVLANAYSLKRHMKRHTVLKPYECPSCDRVFREKSTMLRHIRTQHAGDGVLGAAMDQRMSPEEEAMLSAAHREASMMTPEESERLRREAERCSETGEVLVRSGLWEPKGSD